MSRPIAARACALLALAIALTGACGDSEETASTTTTTVAGAPVPSTTDTTDAVPPSTTTAPGLRTIEVTYAGGQVTGGVRTESVPLGETFVIRATSDIADEVHLHAYDVVADVAPGQTAELRVTATIPGRFEVELEKKGQQLLTIEVR